IGTGTITGRWTQSTHDASFSDDGESCVYSLTPNTYTVGHTCVFTPILVDVAGDGFRLTDRSNGVVFDIKANGSPAQTAWTAPGSDDAFLVLDRNGNGLIEDSTELFGNFTPQPKIFEPNGFAALAEYDKPGNGGNNDGVIDANDAVYSSLRLWQDINHNGVSEWDELHTLPELSVGSISLDYKVSRRQDSYGNQFRYRGKVYGLNPYGAERWAFDVIFTSK
ncbi:MAG TPA: hypothetical protein VF507_07105, partial [Pyrinomonadaceae bacterium]